MAVDYLPSKKKYYKCFFSEKFIRAGLSMEIINFMEENTFLEPLNCRIGVCERGRGGQGNGKYVSCYIMNLTIAPLGKHLVILRSMDNVLKNYFSGKVGLISTTVFLLDERSNTLDIFTRGLILKFHFVGNMTYLS